MGGDGSGLEGWRIEWMETGDGGGRGFCDGRVPGGVVGGDGMEFPLSFLKTVLLC